MQRRLVLYTDALYTAEYSIDSDAPVNRFSLFLLQIYDQCTSYRRSQNISEEFIDVHCRYSNKMNNYLSHLKSLNRIGGVMVSMFASSVVDRGSSPVGSNQRLLNWYLLLLR